MPERGPKDLTYKEASAKAVAREVVRRAIGETGVEERAKKLAAKKERTLKKATGAINPWDNSATVADKVDLIIQEESEG